MKIKEIFKILIKKKYKISVVESCTGGLLASSITSISGASKVFNLGLVTYSNQAKTSVLKIPKQIIKKNGAVSVQCCLAMVNNLSKISKYDLILFHTPHSQFEEINFEEIEVPIFDATGVEYLKNSERI